MTKKTEGDSVSFEVGPAILWTRSYARNCTFFFFFSLAPRSGIRIDERMY